MSPPIIYQHGLGLSYGLSELKINLINESIIIYPFSVERGRNAVRAVMAQVPEGQ